MPLCVSYLCVLQVAAFHLCLPLCSLGFEMGARNMLGMERGKLVLYMTFGTFIDFYIAPILLKSIFLTCK